jgi:hypothetical protein
MELILKTFLPHKQQFNAAILSITSAAEKGFRSVDCFRHVGRQLELCVCVCVCDHIHLEPENYILLRTELGMLYFLRTERHFRGAKTLQKCQAR